MNPDPNQPLEQSPEPSLPPVPVEAITPVPPLDMNPAAVPVAAMTPIASMPLGGGTPTPKKSNKKPLLIIGASVVLLLVIAALLIYFLFFNITKADYQKAVTDSSALVSLEAKSRDSFAAITGSVVSHPAFATADEATKAVTTAKDDFSAYQTALKSYDQQKALHDGDVSKVYKEFKTKYDAYQTYALAYTKSIDTTLTAIVTCNIVFKEKVDNPTYHTYEKESNQCRAALVTAQNTEDPDWKSFVTSYITYLDDTAPAYKGLYDGIAANDYPTVIAKLGELKPATVKFSDASKTIATSITDRFKATEGSAASFKIVTDLLGKKANQ